MFKDGWSMCAKHIATPVEVLLRTLLRHPCDGSWWWGDGGGRSHSWDPNPFDLAVSQVHPKCLNGSKHEPWANCKLNLLKVIALPVFALSVRPRGWLSSSVAASDAIEACWGASKHFNGPSAPAVSGASSTKAMSCQSGSLQTFRAQNSTNGVPEQEHFCFRVFLFQVLRSWSSALDVSAYSPGTLPVWHIGPGLWAYTVAVFVRVKRALHTQFYTQRILLYLQCLDSIFKDAPKPTSIDLISFTHCAVCSLKFPLLQPRLFFCLFAGICDSWSSRSSAAAASVPILRGHAASASNESNEPCSLAEISIVMGCKMLQRLPHFQGWRE